MPKKPAPFQNPAIALSTHGKTWHEVSPFDLEVGDHVMNYGIIQEIRDGLPGLEFIFAGSSDPVTFEPFPILAFTKGE